MGLLLWGSPTLFPLPVDEKGIKKCTAGKQAHDGLFPYLSMERPFRALSKALGFQALHEGLGQPWRSCSVGPIEPFSLTCKGKNGIAGARCPPTIAFSLTGKGEANRGTLKINTLFGANAFSFRLSTKKQIREFQTAVCDSISLQTTVYRRTRKAVVQKHCK